MTLGQRDQPLTLVERLQVGRPGKTEAKLADRLNVTVPLPVVEARPPRTCHVRLDGDRTATACPNSPNHLGHPPLVPSKATQRTGTKIIP